MLYKLVKDPALRLTGSALYLLRIELASSRAPHASFCLHGASQVPKASWWHGPSVTFQVRQRPGAVTFLMRQCDTTDRGFARISAEKIGTWIDWIRCIVIGSWGLLLQTQAHDFKFLREAYEVSLAACCLKAGPICNINAIVCFIHVPIFFRRYSRKSRRSVVSHCLIKMLPAPGRLPQLNVTDGPCHHDAFGTWEAPSKAR